MTTGEHAYLYVGQLVDEGPRTAVYPYAQLREMMAPEECRNAVLDETSTLESEFGIDLVQPLYRLLWTLNSSAGVFTSHTVAAPREHKPPLDWAREYVAVALICLARNRREHHDRNACDDCVRELLSHIAGANPGQDTTGWYISVGPCNVVFTGEMALTTFRAASIGDGKGFGCQLIVGGAASGRAKAAERWSRAVSFVNSALGRLLQGENVRPAPPHRHVLDGVHLGD